MTAIGAFVLAGLAGALLPLVLLRAIPTMAGRLWGQRAQLFALLGGGGIVAWIGLGIVDAHQHICASPAVDAEYRCETSFPLAVVFLSCFAAAILTQLSFAASVIASSKHRHAE